MNFNEAFTIFQNPNIVGQEQEYANQMLTSMMEESPINFIENILNLINDDQIQDRVRINGIKFLTVPLKSGQSTFTYKSKINIPEEVIQNTINAIGSFLTYPKEVSSEAAKVFCFYIRNTYNDQIILSSLTTLLQIVTPEKKPEENELILNLFRQSTKERWHGFDTLELIGTLINILSIETLTKDSISSILRSICQIYREPFLIDENTNLDFVSTLLDLGWHYSEDFPKECSDLLTKLSTSFAIILNYPEFPENSFQCLQKSPYFIKLYRGRYMEEYFKFMYDNHLNEILGIIFQILSEEINEEINDENNHDRWDDPIQVCRNLIYEIYQQRRELLQELFEQYVLEHINEESTGEKYVASLINFTLYTDTFNMTDNDSQQKIDQSIITSLLLNDPNPYIHREGLSLMQNRIVNKQVNLTNEDCQLFLEDYMSDLKPISNGGCQCLNAMCMNGDPDVSNQIICLLLQQAQSSTNTDKVQNILFDVANLVTNVPLEVAQSFISDVLNLVLNLENDSEYYGAYVKILYKLIIKCGQTVEPIYNELVQLIDALLNNEREDDAMYIMASLIESFGGNVPDLINLSINKCLERIPNADNFQNLSAICTLLYNVITNITDENNLNIIIESVMRYIDEDVKGDNLSRLYSLIYSIASINGDVIKNHANELFRLKTNNYFDYITRSKIDVARFVIIMCQCVDINNIPSSLPQWLNIGIDACINIVKYSGTNTSEEQKVEAVNGLIDIYEAANTFGLMENVTTIFFYIYKDFEDRVPEERKERFHMLCPPPDEQKTQAFGQFKVSILQSFAQK